MPIHERNPEPSRTEVDLDALEAEITKAAALGLQEQMRAVERLESADDSYQEKRETIDQAKARLALTTSQVDIAEAAMIRGLNIARSAHGLAPADFDVAALHDLRKVMSVASDMAARTKA